ncbi:hypothetical protein TD95_000495 [Thielaviopsis punctulata]|uniref:Zn(2)-C6 fungal-type domain-containing protein n=1 Tax=Thielaviopsis punctulata TaxID=72032 RepID=A0A0F4ZA58_9PEZI|nr:hypothetical protein TD95_000495 [Thielaviopsis punctulata]
MTAFPQSNSHSPANGADASPDSAVASGSSPLALVPVNGAINAGNAAAPAEQKQKRPRQSKPKVKTGCSNCKQRRIKCDEKRPECTQCTRSNRTCTGYPPPSRSARPHEVISIAPKPQPISIMSLGAGVGPARPIQPLPFNVTRGGPIQLTPRLRRQNKIQHRLGPNGVASASSMLQPMPSSLKFVGDEELYFQLFRTQTACELSGYFDSVFWTRSVLIECQYSEIIKHAVVALGALYRTLETKTQTPPSSPSSKPYQPEADAARHWNFAIKTYGYAINALLESTKSGKSTPRVQLMANVLFACFDSFAGDHKQAIFQIQTGLSLLEKLREARRRTFSYAGEEPVEDELLQMFTRLAIQAKSYDMAFHFPEPWVIRLVSDPTGMHSPRSDDSSDSGSIWNFRHIRIPDTFTSLIEARMVWDKLLETIFVFTETLFAVQQAGKSAPMGLLSPKFMEYGRGFKGQLEAWGIAYQPILDRRSLASISYQERAGIHVLKMSHLMSTVLFVMTFTTKESDFDFHNHIFEEIVNLAHEVVSEEEKRAMKARCPTPEACTHGRFNATEPLLPAYHIKPSFSADLGIIPPLFVVATKCRHPITRRRAIQLLQCASRREGMWDSQLSALIGEYIMNLEEGYEPQVRVWDMGDGSAVSSPDSYRVGTRSPSPGHVLNNGAVYGNGIGEGHVQNTPSLGSSGVYPSQPVSPYTASAAASNNALQNIPIRPVPVPSHNQQQQYSSPQQQQQQQQQYHSLQHPGAQAYMPYIPPFNPTCVIPESRRLMVQAVEFDLRARTAFIELGSRGKIPGSVDTKTRKRNLSW